VHVKKDVHKRSNNLKNKMVEPKKTVADFFAGIGLVGAGLMQRGWQVEYAVDYDDDKREMYEWHFGKGHYHVKNISDVSAEEVPDVTLIHASFPCTDTSLAGARGGLYNGESASFWDVVRILDELDERRPPLIMLENVAGLLTSNNCQDIKAVLEALCDFGYAVDVLLIDASHFVPQSRVRLFIIGVLKGEKQDVLEQEINLQQSINIRPPKIQQLVRRNSELNWNIRSLPKFPERQISLADIVDETAEWWKPDRTEYLFNQMFERHKEKVRLMMSKEKWTYGTVFRRMRKRNGKRRSTAELRTDGIAGCLRCPKGGSARQILLRAGYGCYDARLLNGRECARLMGVPNYKIKESLRLNQILWGFGDAVCASVTDWLAQHYLNPVLDEIMMETSHG
jgi:DNA (cytosine-5)-methyltransferase 1